MTNHYPKQGNQEPVILRINKLWVSEHTTINTETGTAELLVDFLYRSGQSYYKLYTATAIVSQNGLDVTRKHEQNIANAIHSCLKEFSTKSWSKLHAGSILLTEEEAKGPYDTIVAASAYPISTKTPVPGIYLTMNEFRNNAPSITSGYEIRHRSTFSNIMVGGGEWIPVIVTAEGKAKLLPTAWGFTHQNKTYYKFAGVYYQLMFDGSSFSFSGPPINDASGLIVTSAVMGGLVGAAIAGGVAAATSKPAMYQLDLVAGTVTYNGKPVGVNTANAKLIVYRQAKGEQKTPVIVRLNGEEKLFHPNEFIELDLSTNSAGTTISLPDDEENGFSFMPAPNKTYYFTCILNEKAPTEKTVLKEVDKAKGEFDVKGIVFSQKKAAKQ
ncbi:hypothetical protein FVR03_04570 [Pontibacter qinzhouensis]|uniref:Uncharacterized protein n=2 Tax=Pontibacter qinzhouensis TaxID=2603253 RepID=A0A5C8K9M4_9BACT|nr:hypothetical protein FVR03_04570 [Pontibacter qinzhouensis]